MDAKELVTVVMAGGGGAALVAFAKGAWTWATGAAGREREKNASLAKQKKDAEAGRDLADVKRRQAEEHVSILKRQLREAGLEPEERPDPEE